MTLDSRRWFCQLLAATGEGMVEKTIELTGVSSTGIEDAVALAISRAAITIEGIRRVKITEITADVEESQIARWRVTVRVTFGVQDRLHE